MPRLLIVIGSTRPGRVGLPIGTWFADRARAHGGFDVEVADLAEVALPLLDEPKHPRFGDYQHDHTKAWSATVAAADALVFVTPEYNHAYPAALKNAIDYLHAEWRAKPLGFVSYGGVAAGTRAVQQLKPVVSILGLHPVFTSVHIPFFPTILDDDDDGAVAPTDPMNEAADAMLGELVELEGALSVLRQN